MARTVTIERNTKETQISVQLDLDGGEVQVNTGIGFFDHMLTAFGFYAGIGLKLTAKGDLYVDGHHTVEDTGIVLGQAIREALGDDAAGAPFEQLAALYAKTNEPIPTPLASLRDKSVRFTDVCDQDAASMQRTVYNLLHI